MMLAALAAWHTGLSQIVVLGSSSDTLSLRDVIASHYLPFALVIPVEPGGRQDALGRLLPSVGQMRQIDGRATAFVCRNFACQAPVTDPAALDTQLTAT